MKLNFLPYLQLTDNTLLNAGTGGDTVGVKNNIGIYKITTPSNKVYIGQSWDMIKRRSAYKRGKCSGQKYLYASLKKYGYDKHRFEIIHSLPKDVNQDIMDNYECLYMDLYKNCNIKLLNIREGGSRGRNSIETKEKCRIASSGKRHSKETRKKISDNNKGRIIPNHIIEKIKQTKTDRGISMSNDVIEKGKPTRFIKGSSPWNKGRTGVYSEDVIKRMKERKVSDETKKKIKYKRQFQIMRKGINPSIETRLKMSEAAKKRKPNALGLKHTEESKLKISLSKKGMKAWNKGIKLSEEHRNNLSAAKLKNALAKN